MLTTLNPVRKTAWLLFFALSGCYLALAPGTIAGRGYVPEDLNAGLGFLSIFNAWVKGRPIPQVAWTRHGPLPIFFDLPFIKLGKLFITPDFVLSLSALLFTAALMTVVYLWLRKLCTPGMSLLLTIIGAFGTMLWPYAYIGLETKQSFFLMLAGYLGLARGKIRAWRPLLFFSLIGGLAVSVKATGIVLGPAILYILYVQFKDDWRTEWKRISASLVTMGGIWALSVIGWNLFWGPKGGGPQVLVTQWTTDSVFQLFINAIGLFGSPGKGLFVFAPVVLLSIYAVPRALREHREIVVFGLLVTLCMVAFLSILVVVADELWGPRFLHVVIAPLLIVVGAACPRFEWRTTVPLLALGLFGIASSFLGAFYYYGARGWAAANAGQNTLEWYAGDRVWNEISFDARLFSVWLKGGTEPVPWTPQHFWAWTAPADAPPWKTLNLRDYADPQSFLLYYWDKPLSGSDTVIFRICWISLFVGPLLLLWVLIRTIRANTPTAVSTAPIWTLKGRKASRTS